MRSRSGVLSTSVATSASTDGNLALPECPRVAVTRSERLLRGLVVTHADRQCIPYVRCTSSS